MIFYRNIIIFTLISCNIVSSCKISNRKSFSQSIEISDFGAIGDGKHDDFIAFSKALENISDGGTLLLDDKIYFVGDVLHFKNKSINIKSKNGNSTIVSKNGFIDIEHDKKIKFLNQSEYLKGTYKIQLISTSQIKKNDLLLIQSEEMFEEQDVLYPKEFASIISNVSQNNVTLNNSTELDFRRNNVKLSVFDHHSLSLEGINFQSISSLYIIKVKYCSEVNVTNCKFSTSEKRKYGLFQTRSDLGTSGLGLFSTTNIKIKNSSFDYLWYGVLCHSGCNHILIVNCTAFKSHHINNSALGTDNFEIANSVATECESGFDSHETSLSLTLKYCKDIRPKGPSRLRGRRDIAIECEFSGGLDLIYDTHSKELFKNDSLYKKIVNCTIYGNVSNFQGHNIFLSGCEFNDAIVFSKNSGKLLIDNCKFIDKAKKLSNRSELLTISDHSWPEQYYNFEIKNSEFLGAWQKDTHKDCYQMGIYLPMVGDCSGKITNCKISSFERGLVLYGGVISLDKYKNLELDGIVIENCYYGIFQQDFDKTLKNNNININNCDYKFNFPNAKIGKTNKFNK